MKSSALAVAIVLAAAAAARADSPFDVLARPGATWTYDVVSAKHKPTGGTVTVAVAAVHTGGAYTVVELTTTATPALEYDEPVGPILIGPDGVRSVINIGDDSDPNLYTEANLKSVYEDRYLPRIYLPAKLSKRHFKLRLGRFGEDDRDYKLTATITKPDAHTWRLAWKGSFVVPENGEKDSYSASNDFDPAVGLTQICFEDRTCWRLAPAQ